MTDNLERLRLRDEFLSQWAVGEIERNREAIAELVGALNGAATVLETLVLDADERSMDYALTRSLNLILVKPTIDTIRATITKYNHIVDANKMVPTTTEKE